MSHKQDDEQKGAPTVTANDAVEVPAPEADPQADWLLVKAKEPLWGTGGVVPVGTVYKQPPEAARFMAGKGWVEIVT